MSAPWKSSLCCLVFSLVAQAAEPAVLDANLVRSSGAAVKLSAFWGKPVLMFYESPATAQLNQAARDELARLSALYHLRSVIDVVGVANLEGIDWWPARPIALGMVRGEEKKSDVPVLIDLKGELRGAPWRLDPKTSTVLVVSPRGEVVFRAEGRLEGAKFEALRAALAEFVPTVAVQP